MRILLSGGGTGGHIYPALALMKRIAEVHPQSEFLYVGTEKGLESRIVPKAGIPFRSVEIQGLKRSLSPDNLKTIALMFKSVGASKKIIKEFRPDIVIGTGGYVCAPVLFAASRLRIPTIIHEQNSVAGVTNKFLSYFVSRICLSFEDAAGDFANQQNKIVYTGNPRAQEVVQNRAVADLSSFGLQNGRPTVLIFGGSRGAANINRSFLDTYKKFAGKPYQVLLVTGEVHYKEIKKAADSQGEGLKNVKVVPYLDDMPAVFRAVSLVICRSGATTLTELTAMGIPSVLIPSPYVTNDHQRKNAESLVRNGAADMILEKDLQGDTLLKAIDGWMMNETARREMAFQAERMGVKDAGDRLLNVIAELI